MFRDKLSAILGECLFYGTACRRRSLSLLFLLLALTLTIAAFPLRASDSPADDQIVLKVEAYQPDLLNDVGLVVFEFMKEHKNVKVVPFTRLRLETGIGGNAPLFMAFAGKIAPDIVRVPFHPFRAYQKQGFWLSLEDYIGEDLNGDGQIDRNDWEDTNGNGKIDSGDRGLKWEPWLSIDPFYRSVLTINGKPYGLTFGMFNLGLLYRIDAVRAAGLDPTKPPDTWDELFYWMQKLTDPPRQWGFGVGPKDYWEFQPWWWSAGSDGLVVGKKNPRTGKIHWYRMREYKFIDPETGESLGDQPSIWEARFADEKGLRALDFLWKMRWQRWIKHPETGEPINLTDEEYAARRVKDPATGEEIEFTPEDVIEGVIKILRPEDKQNYRAWDRGECAITFGGLGSYLANVNTSAANIGFMPFPAGPGGEKAFFRTPNFMALNSQLRYASKAKRDMAWRLLAAICVERGPIWAIRAEVREGRAKFCMPEDLIKAGYPEYVDEVPEHWRKGYKNLVKYGHTEPYTGLWWNVMEQYLGRQVIGMMMSERDFDYRKEAPKQQEDANLHFFSQEREKDIKRARPIAWGIFFAIAAGLVVIVGVMVRSLHQRAKAAAGKGMVSELVGTRTVGAKIAPWLILAPAVILILMFAYYPLARGSVMAFQEYRILTPSRFVGLDNFIRIILDGKLFHYLYVSLKYTAIMMLLGFVSPILLAILLSEIPVGKMFFRTIYYLPQVSSSIVIMLIWKLLYDPSEYGMFNRLAKFVFPLGQKIFGWEKFKPIDWLGTKEIVLWCVAMPSVWAAVGAACLIYLAALKNVPDELYEAAEIDGSGIWGKFRHITIPTLMPLIIINFIGAFIGTFRSMGNILVLTGGGPGDASMVIGLAIWYRAFTMLQFGIATAMAWILGSLLIGFTIYQLRFLRKVEFRRAEEA